MSDSITIHPREHDKLGIYHVGVTREGFISVAGDVHDIADGETLEFDRTHIKAERHGKDYTFTKH